MVNETALHVACRTASLSAVRALLDTKADVNAKSSEGTTALMLAAAAGGGHGSAGADEAAQIAERVGLPVPSAPPRIEVTDEGL